MEHNDFLQIVQAVWQQTIHTKDIGQRINLKFKLLGRTLKIWSKQLSRDNLKTVISNTNEVIFLLDTLEEFWPLSIEEWNAREILKTRLNLLLKRQRIY